MSILPATETNMFRSPQGWIQRVAPPVQLQLTASSSSPLPICTSLRSINDASIVHRPLQVLFFDKNNSEKNLRILSIQYVEVWIYLKIILYLYIYLINYFKLQLLFTFKDFIIIVIIINYLKLIGA